MSQAGWRQYKERFDGLSQREQHILMIAALVILVFLWDLLFIAPMQRSGDKMKAQITDLNSRMASQSSELVRLSSETSDDPNQLLRAKQDALNTELQRLDGELQSLTGNLIQPQDMARVMEDVLLQQAGRLQLVRVASANAKKITAGVEAAPGLPANNNSASAEGTALYRHGVEIELRGRYFDTLDYLKALEQLPWKVSWDQFEYRVTNYPNAEIRIRVNTLSTNESWIGV